MYKVQNPYKDCHIMDLNLMHVHQYKKSRISGAGILLTISPLFFAALAIAATMIPDMQFFAECQNIPGGDVCSLSFK